MVYGAASVYKGINLRGREANNTVPNSRLIVILPNTKPNVQD